MTVEAFELFIYLLISEIQCCRFEMTALIFLFIKYKFSISKQS